jgi:hypothetical protein
MGGKNPFLGIAYIVVGGLCILLGAVFLATHLIKPRSGIRPFADRHSTDKYAENLVITPISPGIMTSPARRQPPGARAVRKGENWSHYFVSRTPSPFLFSFSAMVLRL